MEGIHVTKPWPQAAPSAPSRPLQITTNSSAEFEAVCDRQDKGELTIYAVEVGKANGQWIVEISYVPNTKVE